MIIRKLDAIRSTDRNVKSEGWESARLLLKDDGMGFSFHITTMYAGEELRMHYKNHLESVFVISGEGTIEDLATGQVHELKPGTVYALNAHDRHIVRPRTDIVTACAFNPPVTGREVHDETGAYPADTDQAPVAALSH
ncbi:MAG: ectoine synthase [Alphaproteobacteria bacterium]|nr:ectoine synthase [Alphaproteobacteria bacterium]